MTDAREPMTSLDRVVVLEDGTEVMLDGKTTGGPKVEDES